VAFDPSMTGRSSSGASKRGGRPPAKPCASGRLDLELKIARFFRTAGIDDE